MPLRVLYFKHIQNKHRDEENGMASSSPITIRHQHPYSSSESDVSDFEDSVDSLGSSPSQPRRGASPATPASQFDPTDVPLGGAQPAPTPSQVANPNNATPALGVPSANAKPEAAKSADEGMQNIIKAYEEAKKAGLDTAISDLVHRIIVFVGHALLFAALVTLTVGTGGIAIPFAASAGLGLVLSGLDLGFSIANVSLRAAGKDGLEYHGDSIANMLGAALRKGGMTDETKIDNITNGVSIGVRVLGGGLTLMPNLKHRAGPSNGEYMDQKLSKMQRMLGEQMVKKRKDADESVSFTSLDGGECTALTQPLAEPEIMDDDDDFNLPPPPRPPAPGTNPNTRDEGLPRTRRTSGPQQSQPSQNHGTSPQNAPDKARQHSAELSGNIAKAEKKDVFKKHVQQTKQNMRTHERELQELKSTVSVEKQTKADTDEPPRLNAEDVDTALHALMNYGEQQTQELDAKQDSTCAESARSDFNAAVPPSASQGTIVGFG